MEAPVQTAARLLGALDELIEREGNFLRGGDYQQALDTRRRSEPIVSELVCLAYAPGVSDFRPQVAAAIGRSARHAAYLQEKMAQAGTEIQRLTLASHRAAQLAPAYAPAPVGVRPRFQAAG